MRKLPSNHEKLMTSVQKSAQPNKDTGKWTEINERSLNVKGNRILQEAPFYNLQKLRIKSFYREHQGCTIQVNIHTSMIVTLVHTQAHNRRTE